MRTETHDERAALALATASIVGDRAAAEAHECSERVIRDWRKRSETDANLAAACLRARARVLEHGWAGDLASAIQAAIGFLERSAKSADVTDPKTITAMARALRTLGEVAAWHETSESVRASGVCETPSEKGGAIPSGNA